jgi:hypothetical protein
MKSETNSKSNIGNVPVLFRTSFCTGCNRRGIDYTAENLWNRSFTAARCSPTMKVAGIRGI